MIVRVGKNPDGVWKFLVSPADGDISKGFVLKDKEADKLLYWYLTEILGREHKYGYWELDLDE